MSPLEKSLLANVALSNQLHIRNELSETYLASSGKDVERLVKAGMRDAIAAELLKKGALHASYSIEDMTRVFMFTTWAFTAEQLAAFAAKCYDCGVKSNLVQEG